MTTLRTVITIAVDDRGNPIQYGLDASTGFYRNLYAQNLGLWTPEEMVMYFCKCDDGEPCPVHCDHANQDAYTKIDPQDPEQIVICRDCGTELR